MDRPLSNNVPPETLFYWIYEDKVKSLFGEFVQCLEAWSRDTTVKKVTLNCVFALLKEKPEQERKLLAILINKLVQIILFVTRM